MVAGGAAQQAGLEPGDRIVAVDGATVRSVAELATRLYGDPPGAELRVTVARGGHVHHHGHPGRRLNDRRPPAPGWRSRRPARGGRP